MEFYHASGLRDAMLDVAEFHEATEIVNATKPQIVAHRVDLRLGLIDEEVKELHDAIDAGDIVEVADALADIIYVAIGMAIEFGIPIASVWDEVHRSNMAKVDPATGLVRRREDGKILKPEGWSPPNIAEAMGI